METRSAHKSSTENTLPLSSLRLLAPPLRLVSAAMWKVMENRDVLHYGKLADFVASVSETVPKLLSYRHEAKLTLGLRARLVLQLCCGQSPPDQSVVLPQLEKIKVSSDHPRQSRRRDVKVESSVSNFHKLVHALLSSPKECKHFFQDVFPVEYGPQFDQALEKLLWEFLVRLDQLLPVPNLAQTVSWLTAAPAVLEECAQSVSQPQLLKTLLQHEKCLGHLKEPGNLPSYSGDSILSSLSLPPSGKVRSENSLTRSTERKANSTVSDSPDIRQVDKFLLIEPTIKLRQIDLPPSASASKMGNSQSSPSLRTEEHLDTAALSCSGVTATSALHANEDDKAVKGSQTKRKHREEEEEEDEGKAQGDVLNGDSRKQEEQEKREVINTTPPGQGQTSSEEGAASILARSPIFQPQVLLRRLRPSDLSVPAPSGAPCSLPAGLRGVRSPSKRDAGSPGRDTKPRRHRSDPATPREEDCLESLEKENGAGALAVGSGAVIVTPRRPDRGRLTTSPAKSDIIFDSEDEDTKNFKGRLFTKRYYRTKHNTYVPTLREFLRPRVSQLGQSSLTLGWR